MISTRLREMVGLRPGTWAAAAALLGLAALAGDARAQGFGPDPFRPYNSQYDAYVFGVAPGALDGVGNPTLNRAGVRNANQFQSAMDGGDDRTDPGNRYDRANRAYDREYNRLYRPNVKADARFDAQRGEVSDIYFRYLRERDPRKRATLFKEYTQAQGRASRELSESPNARNARKPRGSDGIPKAPGLDERPTRRAGTTPPPPGDDEPRASLSPTRTRRPSRPAGVPAAPAAAPTPSDVLDRARRSDGRATPPPPALP
ncbi:hypothetical protein [Paludisphaera mucosa]|uniref:Uncharacterized protein n=1 Tax=Paludisphaera mucosa TaxID=3030827 RepID=A0ABT6F5F1_9BACT|nr:hypothetical protein [Paludisphaera mucosa]MDG3002808.1 hypothetical protein [Paludisphaera mucosa]